MISSVASNAGAAVATAAPQVAKKVAEQVTRNAPWISNMPTRAIASVLLQQDRNIMEHDALYSAVEKSGLMRSRRHFKHCLRMLKDQKRVAVICTGPESPGSAKRKFAVKLTRRGNAVYTKYSEAPQREFDRINERGLKDALL